VKLVSKEREIRKPGLGLSVALLAAIFILIFLFIVTFGLPIQLALFVSWFFAIGAAFYLGYGYQELEEAACDSVRKGMGALLILLAVGALVGTWIAGGVVPTLIYYGLKLISPSFFLVAALLICSLTSLSTGTSWGTAGTVGVAMMGIGEGLGVAPALTAGAVLSGAYFGDKMSPLSDSTVLTASMCGIDVFKHIRSMMYSTVPAYIIVLVMYWLVGLKFAGDSVNLAQIPEYMDMIASQFNISPVMILPALIVITLMAMKKPGFPCIAFGALLGVIWAMVFQGATFSEAMNPAWAGFQLDSGVAFLDRLLNRGGILGMLGVVAVMLFGLGLGGLLQHIGVLEAVIAPLGRKVKNVWQLILGTIFVGHVTNAVGTSMYISLIMTPQMMEKSFRKFRLKPEVLSRTTEDGGTLSAPLYPWTDNAIYMSGVLGVATLAYVPWAFFLWVTPIISVLLAFLNNKGMFYYTDEEYEALLKKEKLEQQLYTTEEETAKA
jgi:NhaC family Na+:H+ antiporter